MLPQWQTGTVQRIEQATANTRRYWVELTGLNTFDFKPGQFVTLDLPIHEQRNKRWRSYSIAGMPDGTNVIELIIVHVDNGLASQYIFNEIKEGSQLTLRGPQGIFVLPELMDKDIYFICTGTGIAPFRSMLQYINHYQLPHKQLHLLYGTRTQADLLYADEMRTLEQMLPAFRYHPVLSRESWEGYTGYVHQVYESLTIERRPSTFYLCGWRPMVDEARQRLLDIGYTKNDIHIEIYG